MASFLELILVLVLFFNSFNNNRVCGDDTLKDGGLDRGQRSERNLWFGPRLGKRDMNLYGENDRTTFLRLLEAADALKYYYDQYKETQDNDNENKVSKKIIFTPKLGRSLVEERSLEVDFTPRLGRRNEESSISGPPLLQLPTRERKLLHAKDDSYRPEFYAPRVGPRMTFSPRLGRNLMYELNPDSNVRITRSVSKKPDN